MSHILMVITPNNFKDEEYFTPREIFFTNNHAVTTASDIVGDIVGSKGGIATATLLLKDVSANNYDCVVFVGGSGSYEYDNNHQIHRIAHDFYSQQRLTTAICHGPILLAKAGVLHGKKATVFSGDAIELQTLGVHYTQSDVVVDDMVITANGPLAASNFAKTIISHFDNVNI